MAVFAFLLPLPLSGHLGALVVDLGCLFFNDETYPPPSHWLTLILVIRKSYLVFIVCLDLVLLL